ncbi:MAG: hypothetical protein AB2689_21640 [Candidatus Thiodiazotropha taylori]
MKSLIDNWKGLKPFEKIGTVVAVVGTIYGGIAFISEKTKDTDKQIVVFNQKTHLGDNDQASFGGTASPFMVQPGAEEKAHLLVYDKALESFESTNGFPTEIQRVLAHYGKQYQKVNLGAYKHVVGVSPSSESDETYQGNSVLIDSYTKLIWRENNGTYYHEKAPVGITSTVNLNKILSDYGYNNGDAKIKSASFIYHGLHSGKRHSQPDSVELVVNNKIFAVNFRSNSVREEERISIPIPPEILNISETGTNRFTLIVLPYQEKYPLPPPDSAYLHKGPGHFRDIELWEGKLTVTID